MAEDDRERFMRFIAQGSLEGTLGASLPPGSLHTNMIDAENTTFRAEVFHVCFKEADGSLRHLVGIREAGTGLMRKMVYNKQPTIPLRGIFQNEKHNSDKQLCCY